MYKNIALFCLFTLLCACGPSPSRNQSGLFGRYPENYDNGKGFTLWMPKNMHAEQGMYAFVVQKHMDHCANGDFDGGKYNSDDVYKELPDGGRVYAYYYYYNQDESIGVDAPAFNLTPMHINVDYYVVMNFIVNKDGIITRCKYLHFY
ncbi:MAG TPA: hypothetical protein VEZ52_11610 [Desulfovibrio sp.]|uniref:hypothetical protein n=1 Tax=Desulfovibrio sp. TaxID=885 RepID=UPI002D540C3D|nr:hypothetical protein [Desulfovibrio sp.]HZF62252.1 hypothetical protein [Desulfovibrio sp.]